MAVKNPNSQFPNYWIIPTCRPPNTAHPQKKNIHPLQKPALNHYTTNTYPIPSQNKTISINRPRNKIRHPPPHNKNPNNNPIPPIFNPNHPSQHEKSKSVKNGTTSVPSNPIYPAIPDQSFILIPFSRDSAANSFICSSASLSSCVLSSRSSYNVPSFSNLPTVPSLELTFARILFS